MKTPVAIALGILVWLTSATSLAQSIAYTFVTLDIPTPDGYSGVAIMPEDINDDGVVVANMVSSTGMEVVVGDRVNTNTFRCADMAFADAYGSSVNDHGDVAGGCVTEPNGSKIFGFVRDRQGHHSLLAVPGADHTLALGISSDRQVVGQYYTPLDAGRSGLFRIHGFRWEGGRFETIDFPLNDAYTTLRSVNKRGQILGEYYRFDPATNETLEHNWFLYENGRFTQPFPPSLEWQGGPAVFLADMNDAGQIVGVRYNGGPAWNGLFLFDRGSTFNVAFPTEFVHVDVRGMNNRGQFVGSYTKLVVIDPEEPRLKTFGYVATPVPLRSSAAEVADVTSRPAPLAISCPSPVLTSLDFKPLSVTLTPAVTGGVQPITTTCSPVSQSLLPVGHTSFTCSASDARLQRVACTSVVVVLAPN